MTAYRLPSPTFWALAGRSASQMAAWLVLVGLGRQHLPLWFAGLLPLVVWLAASAGLRTQALAGLARRASAQGPTAMAVLAACLWWMPHAGSGAPVALLLAAVAWAVVGLAVEHLQSSKPVHALGLPAVALAADAEAEAEAATEATAPKSAPQTAGWSSPRCVPLALGFALGSAAGLGPLLRGEWPAGWSALALAVAALWQGLATQRVRSLGAPPAGAAWTEHDAVAPPVAARPVLAHPAVAPLAVGARPITLAHAVQAPWRMRLARAASYAAMVSMMASLPAQLEACTANGLPSTLALALHALAMVLPLALWPWLDRWARLQTWCGLALLAGGVALGLLPGWQGFMAASMLQSTAWGLVMAHAYRVNKPVLGCDLAAPRSLGFQAAALVLFLGWVMAHGGADAWGLVHGALAVAGALALGPTRLPQPLAQGIH